MKSPHRRHFLQRATAIGVATLIAGCATAPPPAPVVYAPPPPPAPPRPAAPPPVESALPPPEQASAAQSARDYRRDAAGHLYRKNQPRIYTGKMPPLLYAVGVLDVDVDARGQVLTTNWVRAPRHAPEVMAEIERLVRQAAPFPAPVRLGRVTYTDTWLWHKSGRFQLDTLTEGQSSSPYP